MRYAVEYTPQAIKAFKKLDKHTLTIITSWIEKNLAGCENPCQHGKGLTANHAGEWSYRIGNYRVLAEIQQKKIVILILKVGHRKDVY